MRSLTTIATTSLVALAVALVVALAWGCGDRAGRDDARAGEKPAQIGEQNVESTNPDSGVVVAMASIKVTGMKKTASGAT
jgi:hypothetical protein